MKNLDRKESLLIYSIALIIVFYLLPLLFKGSIASLFIINPITILVFSIICAKNYKFNFVIALITALLFLPTIFIFYNESAWIYIVFYVVLSIIGGFIGLIQNRRK